MLRSIMRSLIGSVAVVLLLVRPLPALAQVDDDAALRTSLELERLAQDRERIDEGIGLLTFALASVLIGGLAAGVGIPVSEAESTPSQNEWWWVGAGLGTAAWGAVNVAFAVPMIDPGGNRERRIRDEEIAEDALRARALELSRDQYNAGAVFALNLGLDVFYIAGGALLAVIGNLIDRNTPESRFLEGYGIAMGVQGVGLLCFDLAGWMRASTRGDRLMTLAR